MSKHKHVSDNIRITAEGIGGINTTTVTLGEGVNLLEGQNATNRTSFLQAIMAALGSDNATLKRDHDEGFVELEMGGETYTRTLERTDEGIQFGGEPYSSEITEAELFAFLLELNEVRQAVAAERDLREIVMRPVDTGEIERQILDLQENRREIDNEIQALEKQRKKLPKLESERGELEDELEEIRDELAEDQAELASADVDVEDRQEDQERLEETLNELSETRSELETIQYRIETEQEALATDRDERKEREAQQKDIIETPDRRLTEIEGEIERLRQQKRTCDTRLSKLQRIIQFNEEMLDGEGVLGELIREDDDTAVTDQLVEDTEATCWTCGSTVEKAELNGMLEQLRKLSQSQRRERNRLKDELAELIDERDSLETAEKKRKELAEQVNRLETDIDRREETIESLKAERAELRDRTSELEEQAEQLEGVSESRVLELHKTVNEKEVTVERLERELETVVEEVEEIESDSDRIAELEQEREQITEQITELRTRIDRLETEVVEAFNEHMEALVDLLEYDNLDRVWMERKSAEPAGRAQDDNTSFELHIIRSTEDGTTYEDRIDHLSESEREVVGLVFALAGYLVHEVYETVPFLLLDSLEAIDAERISRLIEYLAEYAPTLVAALLTEDTQMLDDSYPRIKEI